MPKQFRALTKSSIGICIMSLFLLHSLDVIHLNFIEKVDGISDDWRLKATLKQGIDDRVIIVDVDEVSLTHLGQWPWNRHHLANLIKQLFEHYQVRALGLDMVFAESASKDMQTILSSVEQNPNIASEIKQVIRFEAKQDDAFAQALKDKAISSGIFFLQNSTSHLNDLPKPIAEVDPATHAALFLPKPQGYTANQSIFQNATQSAGFFDNPSVDDDGVFRRVPLLQSFNGKLYPSLALSVARLALDDAPLDIQLNQQDQWLAIQAVQLGHRVIPTDKTGAVTIPFRGPEGSFPYISAWNVIQKNVAKDILAGKIILLGTSAPGLLDLRSTPVDESMPGVEVHANIIAGILDSAIPYVPTYSIGAMFIVYLLLGLILIAVPHLLSAINTLFLCSALAIFWIGLNFYLWHQHLIFPLAGPVIMVLCFFIFHTFWGFFVESRKKRAITQLFGQYVPPELVNEMAAQPDKVTITGQNKHLSVLFSDVRNFTSISESLEPAALSTLMNDILTPLTHTIYEHRGTVDKYMGDAIMAFWGAPVDEPLHAHQAISCALDMQKAIAQVSAELQQKGLPEIAMGVGINTGNMSVGNMGSVYRMAYTVLGDAVNLGSRLEGLSKSYGADIVVSEATKQEAPDYLYLPLDRVQVKGKEEPINIYQPLCHLTQASDAQVQAVSLMQNMMSAYVDQLWVEASLYLDQIYNLGLSNLNTLIGVYRARLVDFSQAPPNQDWDGVFKHTSK